MSFPKNFLWGAVYQGQGSCHEGEKSLRIGDAYLEKHSMHIDKGKLSNGFYDIYKEDVVLMKQMRLKAFRFSISWPKIMPQEHIVNAEEIQSYKNLVQELAEAGITPICTLYDGNLPAWLHRKGGWLYEGISRLFAEFTDIVVKKLSDMVYIWITISGPAGFLEEYVPFHLVDEKQAEQVKKICMLTKNVLLANGKAYQVIRQKAYIKPFVGFAIDGKIQIPCRETKSEIEKSRRRSFSNIPDYRLTSWWADPIITGKMYPLLSKMISGEDLAVIRQPLDFLGYNCYKCSSYGIRDSNADVYLDCPRTATDCPIIPEILYWAVRFYYERYNLPVLISENGMANVDFEMSDGMVHDQQRVQYLKWYLKCLKRAADENYPVLGYLYRSLFDSFEWEDGYGRRFGLVYVDYQTQKRIPKDSAYWYAQVIKENGKDL